MAVVTAEILLAPKPIASIDTTRRFELPDIERHGVWFLPRFVQAFPRLNNRQALGFLRSVMYSNEFMFLYQDHAVGLAQTMNDHVLSGKPIIWERFVWVEDPDNAMQVESAAHFYDHFVLWAKRQSIDTMMVEESSDVPHETVKAHVGRIFSKEQKFVRV